MSKENITTVTQCRKLKPRNEPYWHKLGRGKYLGFRKTVSGSETWAVRFQEGSAKKYDSLGSVTSSFKFEDATKAAEEWFNQLQHVEHREDIKMTVADAIDNYVEELAATRSKDAAYRVEKQMDKHVPEDLGKVQARKLTTTRLNKWRNGLLEGENAISKSSANRNINSLKAALNMAYNQQVVPSNIAWQRLSSFRNADNKRTLFLAGKQVKQLAAKSSEPLKQLIEASIYTGARPGELRPLTVADFDAKQGVLHIMTGKTAERDCYLSPEAIAFFKDASSDKLPNAPLLANARGLPWTKKNSCDLLREAVKKAKLPSDTVFYSFRHYSISKSLLAGITPNIVAENCGTSIRMLEKHYAKFMAADRTQMMSKVAFPTLS